MWQTSRPVIWLTSVFPFYVGYEVQRLLAGGLPGRPASNSPFRTQERDA